MTKFSEIKEKIKPSKDNILGIYSRESEIKWFLERGLVPEKTGCWIEKLPISSEELEDMSVDDILHDALYIHVNYDRYPSGLKLHISVAPEDLEKAWDVLEDYLSEQELHFKVANPFSKIAENDADGQNGKMFTVYLSESKHFSEENDIAEKITSLLKENNIAPGINVKGDGNFSDYVYYRHSRVEEKHDIHKLSSSSGNILAQTIRDWNENNPDNKLNMANPYNYECPFGSEKSEKPILINDRTTLSLRNIMGLTPPN